MANDATSANDAAAVTAELSELRRQVRWLLDKEAIRNLKQLYCRFSDNGRYDEFATLFTDDFTCQIHGPPQADGSPPPVLDFPSRDTWVSFARTQGSLRARVDATAGREGPDVDASGNKVPGAFSWSPGAAHHMHGGEIEFTGPDTARAIWPSQFDGINGYYDEEYRRENGQWRIARERFYSQARREYSKGDYPYAVALGETKSGPRIQALDYPAA